MVRIERLMKGCELHRLVRLRQRHILTKHNKVRLRYVTGCALSVLLASWTALNNTGVTFSAYSTVSSFEVANLDFADVATTAALEPAAGADVQAVSEEDLSIPQTLQSQI